MSYDSLNYVERNVACPENASLTVSLVGHVVQNKKKIFYGHRIIEKKRETI